MKTKTVTQYEFEEGDVIVNYMYNWVAIKVRGDELLAEGKHWKHTNGEHMVTYFDDATVERYLRQGTWFYMGNRVEREQADKVDEEF